MVRGAIDTLVKTSAIATLLLAVAVAAAAACYIAPPWCSTRNLATFLSRTPRGRSRRRYAVVVLALLACSWPGLIPLLRNGRYSTSGGTTVPRGAQARTHVRYRCDQAWKGCYVVDCEDRVEGPSCPLVIEGGTMSCAKDFCSDCPLAGVCSLTCELCNRIEDFQSWSDNSTIYSSLEHCERVCGGAQLTPAQNSRSAALLQLHKVENMSALQRLNHITAPVEIGNTSNDGTMFIISLQGVRGAHPENNGRLDAFRHAWEGICGSKIQFEFCPGVVDRRRGYGLTKAFQQCFDKALVLNPRHAIFLEDDARLLSPGFCNVANRTAKWQKVPDDAFVVLLGGHHIGYKDADYSRRSESSFRIHESSYSLGSYAFMVPRHSLDALREGFSYDLRVAESSLDVLAPDLAWYKYGNMFGKRIFVHDPLIVEHIAGFSNTWNGIRGGVGAGVAGESGTERFLCWSGQLPRSTAAIKNVVARTATNLSTCESECTQTDWCKSFDVAGNPTQQPRKICRLSSATEGFSRNPGPANRTVCA
jgi:hypothetical protein